MEEKAKAMGLEDRVLFTGVRSDVCDLMQAMDVFVFPSLYAGLPVTMVEAQSAGLPCVISNRVPAECIVTSGLVTSMSLDETSEQWAQHILSRADTLKTDHEQEIVAAGYDITAAANNLEQFYLQRAEEQV